MKMDGAGLRREGKRFRFGNVMGDPFALATTSTAFLGWILAFVASIISAINTPFPKYNWWTLSFMFFCILGVTIVIGSDSRCTYSTAAVGFLSAGIVMTSSAVQTTIYSGDGASEAAGAGYILLAVVCIIWVFYFGSQDNSRHRSYVDSFALQKDGRPSDRSSRQMSARYTDQNGSQLPPAPQSYASNHLNGFETSTAGFGNDSATLRMSQQPRFGSSAPTAVQSQAALSSTAEQGMEPADADYKYRARAIYSYEANPDDPNEISFQKTEMLEVSDVSGRWWQARKANGQTGIAPSNYLMLL